MAMVLLEKERPNLGLGWAVELIYVYYINQILKKVFEGRTVSFIHLNILRIWKEWKHSILVWENILVEHRRFPIKSSGTSENDWNWPDWETPP